MEYTAEIKKYDEGWVNFGQLLSQRVGHASILIGNLAYTIGGSVRDYDNTPE